MFWVSKVIYIFFPFLLCVIESVSAIEVDISFKNQLAGPWENLKRVLNLLERSSDRRLFLNLIVISLTTFSPHTLNLYKFKVRRLFIIICYPFICLFFFLLWYTLLFSSLKIYCISIIFSWKIVSETDFHYLKFKPSIKVKKLEVLRNSWIFTIHHYHYLVINTLLSQ